MKNAIAVIVLTFLCSSALLALGYVHLELKNPQVAEKLIQEALDASRQLSEIEPVAYVAGKKSL